MQNFGTSIATFFDFLKKRRNSGILSSVCQLVVSVFLKCLLSIIRERIKINGTMCPSKGAEGPEGELKLMYTKIIIHSSLCYLMLSGERVLESFIRQFC